MYIYMYIHTFLYIYSNTILEREPRPQRTCPMCLRPYSVTLPILYPNTMKVIPIHRLLGLPHLLGLQVYIYICVYSIFICIFDICICMYMLYVYTYTFVCICLYIYVYLYRYIFMYMLVVPRFLGLQESALCCNVLQCACIMLHCVVVRLWHHGFLG